MSAPKGQREDQDVTGYAGCTWERASAFPPLVECSQHRAGPQG